MYISYDTVSLIWKRARRGRRHLLEESENIKEGTGEIREERV
jgi:hypothetical protein